jgi:hypothetical protein
MSGQRSGVSCQVLGVSDQRSAGDVGMNPREKGLGISDW